MPLSSDVKRTVIEQFQRLPGDTGSPEVQVALLSEKIKQLTDHFKVHTQDHHSRQGLMKMVARRRKLLDYLKTCDSARYEQVIARLGLRR
jgi:small subunit ribosomal protein S15